MIKYAYSYRDKLGVFNDPFFVYPMQEKAPDDVVIRSFVQFIKTAKPEQFPADLELYLVGQFNCDKGVFVPCEPKFLANGAAVLAKMEAEHA